MKGVGQWSQGSRYNRGNWTKSRMALKSHGSIDEEILPNLGSLGGAQVGWGITGGGIITTSAMLTSSGPPGSERITSGWVGSTGPRERRCSWWNMSNWIRSRRRRRLGTHRIAILETVVMLPHTGEMLLYTGEYLTKHWINDSHCHGGFSEALPV